MTPASGTHVAETNTPAESLTPEIQPALSQYWANISTCKRRKHIYTEALKRNDKNNVSRYNDL